MKLKLFADIGQASSVSLLPAFAYISLVAKNAIGENCTLDGAAVNWFTFCASQSQSQGQNARSGQAVRMMLMMMKIVIDNGRDDGLHWMDWTLLSSRQLSDFHANGHEMESPCCVAPTDNKLHIIKRFKLFPTCDAQFITQMPTDRPTERQCDKATKPQID